MSLFSLLSRGKKVATNLALILMLSNSLAGCAVLQEWFESVMSIQEEQQDE